MIKRGRKPDLRRRRRAADLRRQGLTEPEIAKTLGCTKQNVSYLLRAQSVEPCYTLHCSGCNAVIAHGRGTLRLNGLVYCLACLQKLPAPTLGQRLKAYRVAADLRQAELAERIGVHPVTVSYWERDLKTPVWHTIASLITVLGVDFLTKPPVKAEKTERRRKRTQ
jgi:transcriptional regulator with XRE-family HTH domain